MSDPVDAQRLRRLLAECDDWPPLGRSTARDELIASVPALLEEVETLRASQHGLHEECDHRGDEIAALQDERDALRSELVRSDRELVDLGAKWAIKNDALRAEVERVRPRLCPACSDDGCEDYCKCCCRGDLLGQVEILPADPLSSQAIMDAANGR